MRWFLLLLLASVSYAISSSEAIELLGFCLRENNPQLIPLPQVFSDGGYSYWVFYSPLSHSKRIFVAVEEAEGAIVKEEDTLKRLSGGVYDYLGFEEYVKKRGWTADSLRAVLADALRVANEQWDKLQIFKDQTREKYPALSFTGVETALEKLRSNIETTSNILDDAANQQQYYESNPGVEAATQLLNAYNESFKALFETFSSLDDYSKSISAAEAQVYKMGIPDPDNKNINSNLENLREVGLSALYSKAKAADPRVGLNKFLSEEAKWSEDSVSSYLFEDLRCRVNAAYKEIESEYKNMIDLETSYRKEGFGQQVDSIKEDRARLEVFRQKRTTESYNQFLESAPQFKQKITSLKEQVERGNVASTATPLPPKGPDALTIGIVLVVLALGAYAMWAYVKKKQEEQEGL